MRKFAAAIVILFFGISLHAQSAPFGVDTTQQIENAPFSAHLSMAMSSKGSGTSMSMAINGEVYRDSAGRMRIDMEMPGNMKMTELFDHSQNTLAVWSNQTKVAMVHSLPATVPGDKAARNKTAAPRPDPPGTQETLNGMKVFKSHQNITMPAGAMGNTDAAKMEVDIWYAPSVSMPIKMVALDSPMGDFTFELSDLKQDEPDAALFHVPADYASQQLPDAK
jgi:hypothetical protein